MFNKTFKTLDKYPKIYLGFLISAVIAVLFACLSSSIGINYLQSAGTPGLFSAIFLLTLISMSSVFIVYTLLYIFFYPFLFSYIKMACMDIASQEDINFFTKDEVNNAFTAKALDYKNNLKSDWYKIIFVYILLIAISIVSIILIGAIFFFLSFFTSELIDLLFPAYFVFFIIALLFAQIASVCVILEDNFKNGISTTLKYGKKIIFPLLGTSLFISIPLLILSLFINQTYWLAISSYSFSALEIVSFSVGDKMLIAIIFIFSFLYGVYRSSFIYTYIAHKCIYEKCDDARLEEYNIKFEGDINWDNFMITNYTSEKKKNDK